MSLAGIALALASSSASGPMQTPPLTEMAGYLIVPHERVESKFNSGFSMYVSAWPLLRSYPGQEFQSGLFGTWMFPQFEGQGPKDHYTDIEGGLGWWRDTRFATETPKFIMGGVALNFSEWANGPGAGKGRDWSNPTGLYGVAQLSPWLLWPPDGLNLKQGTSGELFGYGYLPLPLQDSKTKTAGSDSPTGDKCWTLFLNTANFKGPVAFFTPYFWSKASVQNPKLSGLFLDSRPSEPNRAIQMETQHIPAFVAKDREGTFYAKIAPTQFPGMADKESPLLHQVTAYGPEALWEPAGQWLRKGGRPVPTIKSGASAVHEFKGGGYATWKINLPGVSHDKAPLVDWDSFAQPIALNSVTYGYKWKRSLMAGQKQDKRLLTLPEYYRLGRNSKGEERWVVVPAAEVPDETGLAQASFPVPKRSTEPYVTPSDNLSAWKKPGPAAGPFRRVLGDGSEVTYYWYRFADQPALLNADLSPQERETMQRRVEQLQRSWTKKKDYLAPPSMGSLASLDPTVIVQPPKGMEAGYVPIVTRQGRPLGPKQSGGF